MGGDVAADEDVNWLGAGADEDGNWQGENEGADADENWLADVSGAADADVNYSVAVSAEPFVIGGRPIEILMKKKNGSS